MNRFKVTSIILASIILLIIPPAVANLGAAIWDGGGGDGLWSNPANWSGDVLPGPTSVVRIENTADEVHVDMDVTLSGDGQLYLDGDPGISPTLVVDPGVTLTLSGSLHSVRGHSLMHNQGTVIQGGRTLCYDSSSVINDGTWTVTAGKLEPNSSVPFVNNDTLVVSGEATLEVWRSIVNHGTVELIGGTDSNPEMSFVNNGEFHNASGGVVIGTGPEEPVLHLGRTSSFGGNSVGTFRNDGTVTLAGLFLVFDGSTLINTGTFDNSGGRTITLGKIIIDDTGTLLPGTLDERQKYWTGGGDATSWSDPANWSPFPTIPSSSIQRVFIEGTPDGAAITIDVDAHVRTLTVSPVPGLLDLTIASGVSLAIGTFNQYSFLLDGTHLTNYGTLAIDFLVIVRENASVDNQGTLTVTDILSNSGELINGGNLTVTATGEISNYGTFTNTGAITNDGMIRNRDGIFDSFGALDNTAGTFNNDGTFISECGSSLLGTISGNPPVVIPCDDTTPPELTVPGDITVLATGPLGSVVTYSASAIDIVDGAITPICTPPSGTTFPIGTTNVVCSATDAHSNTATAEFDINVRYDFSWFYAPLEEGKVYKLGRTLPVKFQLFFVDGTPAVTASATIKLQMLAGSEPTGEPIDASSTSEADSGNIFRLSEDMYIYNLATSDLQKGYYRIEVDVGDGSGPKAIEIAFK